MKYKKSSTHIEDATNELKSLYRNGAYEEAFHLASDILKFAPHNRLARKVLLRAEKKFTARHHTRVIIFLSALMFFLIIGGYMLYEGVNKAMEDKNQKISNLVQEVGDLKTQDLVFFNKIKENEDSLNEVKIELESGIESSSKETNDEIKKAIYVQNKNIKEELETQSQELGEKIELGEGKDIKEVLSGQEKKIQAQKNSILELARKNEEIEKKLSYFQDENKEFFLVLGINSGLADTIIIAELDKSKRKVFLTSVPRDLQVSGRKINEYYNLYGVDIVKNYISEIASINIKNYFVVDFDSFKEIVDKFGGIDVKVENDIYDPSFPDENLGYEVYEIKKGDHHLNGEEALKFARSRKSTNDYDRSRRQQKVVEALIIASKNSLNENDLSELLSMANELISLVKTAANPFDVAKLAYDFSDAEIVRRGSLDESGLLYSTKNIKGQFILLPKDGDFEKLGEYIRGEI